MSRLLRHATLHLGARLASVALSFVLFAWIGRLLIPADASRAYAFTFAFGFALATIRMSLQLGAGVDGLARNSVRYRQARRGYATLVRLLPLLAVVVAATTWVHTQSWVLTSLASTIAVSAAPDIDLIRGLRGRSSLFSISFASGSVLALAMLQWVVPATLSGVVLALICQWIPVAISNLTAWRLCRPGLMRTPIRITDAAGTLLLAGFDGLILNMPFLGLFALPLYVSLELSLVMRVFVASLPMLPLLLHWSNSREFNDLATGLGMRPRTGFMVALWLSGIAAGTVFMLTYQIISRQEIQPSTVMLYLLLLSGYAIFAPSMRLVSSQRGRFPISLPLFACLGFYVFALSADAILGYPSGAWPVVVIQTSILSLTGLYFTHKLSQRAVLNSGV